MIRYTIYVVLDDGKRYIFHADEFFYEFIRDYINYRIDAEKLMQLSEHDLYSLTVLEDCKYILVKNKNSKIIKRLDLYDYVDQ